MRKKISIVVAVVILLSLMVIVLAGCGVDSSVLDRIASLEKKLNDKTASLEKELNDKIAGQQLEIDSLNERMAKVESTILSISELDSRLTELESAGADQSVLDAISSIQSDMMAVQRNLATNTANDADVKAMVTSMQLALNQAIATLAEKADTDTLSDIADSLAGTQTALDKLYDATYLVYEYENDKQYRVSLNGVLYYTITFHREFHDGTVNSEEDIAICRASKKHWCGRLDITNYTPFDMYVSTFQIQTVYPLINEEGSLCIRIKENLQKPTADIGMNQTARWYFDTAENWGGGQMSRTDLQVCLPAQYTAKPVPAVYIKNFWDGVSEPILGTQS